MKEVLSTVNEPIKFYECFVISSWMLYSACSFGSCVVESEKEGESEEEEGERERKKCACRGKLGLAKSMNYKLFCFATQQTYLQMVGIK